MKHNIILLGNQANKFLLTISDCLKYYGIQISLPKIFGSSYMFEINDFISSEFSFSCSCFDLPLSKISDRLCEAKGSFKNASQIICTIPIKMLPEFRYNVDESWENIDKWLSPCAFQKAVRHSLPKENIPIVWVLTGISAVSITNSFFSRKEHNLSLDKESMETFETPQIVNSFLDVCGEQLCTQNSNKNEITCFGFFNTEPMEGKIIGEKIKHQWAKLTLLPLFKKLEDLQHNSK